MCFHLSRFITVRNGWVPWLSFKIYIKGLPLPERLMILSGMKLAAMESKALDAGDNLSKRTFSMNAYRTIIAIQVACR